jgi:hypothetical protein
VILRDRPVRDETGKLLAVLPINELSEGLPVELWLRRGRVVVRAYNEAGCNATEVDVTELVSVLKDGSGAIDLAR